MIYSLSNMNPTKTTGMKPGAHDGHKVPVCNKTPTMLLA
jgi:hypothetical protein